MTKKRLFLLGFSAFFLINNGVFAWGGFDTAPTTYYTYTNSDLPSIYDGYTLKTDTQMYNGGLASYYSSNNYCEATITRNLSLGSQGTDVATTQDYLFDQDFLQTQPNGYYGYGTKNAVKLFQSRYGINTTGTVGPQTMNLLNNLICGGNTGANNSYVANSSRTTEIATTVTSNNSYYPTGYQSSVYPVQSTVNSTSFVPAYSNINQPVYPVTVNRAPTMTIVIPMNKSFYKEGDTIPASWVTANMNVNHYNIMMTNTSTGLEKQVAALPGTLKQYNVTLTKELLDSVCAGTTACTGINANSYRFYVIAHYQTVDGELSIRAYADQMTIQRPETLAQVSLSPSKSPVMAGDTIKLYGYVPNTGVFSQYQNLYWRIRPICAPGITLTVNGMNCGNDIYVYQSNINSSPEITVTINGNLWGPTEVTFEASVLSYYGGQELGRTTTKILVNK